MSREIIIYRVEADYAAPITVTLTGVNISGYAMRANFKRDNNSTAFSITGTIVTAASGIFRIDFTNGILTRGRYQMEFEIWPGGSISTAAAHYTLPRERPITLVVRPNLRGMGQ